MTEVLLHCNVMVMNCRAQYACICDGNFQDVTCSLLGQEDKVLNKSNEQSDHSNSFHL